MNSSKARHLSLKPAEIGAILILSKSRHPHTWPKVGFPFKMLVKFHCEMNSLTNTEHCPLKHSLNEKLGALCWNITSIYTPHPSYF